MYSTAFIMVLLLLLLLASVQGEELQESLDLTTVEARHGEVFSILLNASLLSGTSDVRANDTLRFWPSVRGAPDLPGWLAYSFSERHRTSVVYGVPPPHLSEFWLEIIVTNLRTYQISRREVLVLVSDNADPRRHEVQLKINNMDPVDLFFDTNTDTSHRKQPKNASNIDKLHEIFQEVLWPESGGDLRLTRLEVGDLAAVVPRPGDHSGALLRLASSAPFSPQLQLLQQEVRPLWARVPCPRNFKRSKFERHFREREFKMDWCQFKLFESGKLALPVDQPALPVDLLPSPAPSLPDVLLLPARAAVPARSYISDFLTTIGIPLLVSLVLCAALTCIMCCQGEHLETDSDGEFFDNVFSVFVRRRPAEIQMVQYAGGAGDGRGASLPRSQTSTLRRAALRDVSPRLADQTEFDPSRREASLLRDVSPRLTSYRDPLSPAGSVPTTPDSDRYSQRQPPPYPSLSRRS